MKYHISNFNPRAEYCIGPIAEKLDFLLLLEKLNPNLGFFDLRPREGASWDFNYLFIQGDRLKHGKHSAGMPIISYQTFMEHNTKKIYRIKTLEELKAVPHVRISETGFSLEDRNSLTKGMFPYLGREISQESYNKIITGCAYGEIIDEIEFYNWASWMVTEEIVPIKLEDMKEAVAYKLKKEYPGRKIGETARYKVEVCDSHFLWDTDGKVVPTEFQPDQVPEWFEPVYKEIRDKIEIEVGTPSRKVFIYSDKTYSTLHGNGRVEISKLEGLRYEFGHTCKGHEGLSYSYKLERIWVGCESGTSIGLEDIEKIINAYKEEYEN